MTPTFEIPYGRGRTAFHLPHGLQVEVVEPPAVPAAPDPRRLVEAALDALLGGVEWAGLAGARTAAVAINDETRPVPHQHLLPPLLARLGALGLAPDAIQLLIAAGAHPPMPPERWGRVVPPAVAARYPVACHDADAADLVPLGTTSRGTPVQVNRRFMAAELRIVVGVVEPHQFQGFSGGVKSAAVGLAARETIDRNHSLMVDPRARLGRYADNPTRQDVEESGHPKDLNLYQAQKALLHASLVTRDGAALILAAACPDGIGSPSYEAWMEGKDSHQAVMAAFEREPFRVGPHKAFLLSRDAIRVRTILMSELAPEVVRRMLLEPAGSIDAALGLVLPDLPGVARVGVLPMASSTIPYVTEA